MKSLYSKIFGRPRKLDDFLDRAKTSPPDEVALSLSVEQVVQELRVFDQLVGSFRWRFGDKTFVCDAVCGTIDACCGGSGRQGALARANQKLCRLMRKIRQAGIHVTGSEKRFDIHGTAVRPVQGCK